ncbi:chymotrypsin-like elastase family member 2A [Sergentomyia squamirostris]
MILYLDKLKSAVSLQILNSTQQLEHFCGGTLIQGGWIVTASHCLMQIEYEKHEIFAEIGSTDLYRNPEALIKVQDFYIRPLNQITFANDIALIRLPLSYRDLISNIVLPMNPKDLSLYEECFIVGYGSDHFLKDIIGSLRQASIEITLNERCKNTLDPYGRDNNPGMFCAGGGTKDACQGDSGSGLICQNVLVGIVSYGSSCGVPGIPGVYTDIQYHMDWIELILVQCDAHAM